MDELRRKGLEKMNEVYAWEMPDVPDEFFTLTVEHLFGRIWTRPGLSMRDRRMMLLAVLTALSQDALLEIQVNAALANAELTAEELQEVAIFLTHYVGFPLGAKLDGVIKRVIARRKKAAPGTAEAKKANVDAALKMHTGTSPT